MYAMKIAERLDSTPCPVRPDRAENIPISSHDRNSMFSEAILSHSKISLLRLNPEWQSLLQEHPAIPEHVMASKTSNLKAHYIPENGLLQRTQLIREGTMPSANCNAKMPSS
jgi:hypothetical protein